MASHVASGRSVEASGRTVEQAIEAALARIGRSRDEVEVQVLREASKGVLGFGAHDAIVRVTELVRVEEEKEQPEPPRAAPQPQPQAPVERHEPAATRDTVAEEEEEDEAPTEALQDEDDERYSRGSAASDDELVEIARGILLEILERMGILADVFATWSEPQDEKDEPALILDIIGDDLGLLIGRRGETLRDLQYILRLLVGRRIQGWANIVVDVEGYKQRRERNLRELARRMADRVVATGRAVHMEPMSAYERRIVHLELREIDGIFTKSSGEGEHRKVGIFPQS